ncbi:hypothetical protein GCM10007061_12580 [Kocuria marina]|nr:hypothetical protein GCM10007061_12580 [Kocuria marina]
MRAADAPAPERGRRFAVPVPFRPDVPFAAAVPFPGVPSDVLEALVRRQRDPPRDPGVCAFFSAAIGVLQRVLDRGRGPVDT